MLSDLIGEVHLFNTAFTTSHSVPENIN